MQIIRKAFIQFFTAIAKVLPLWKEAKSVDVLPPIFSLPVALPKNIALLPPEFAKQFVAVKSIPKQRIFILNNVFVNRDAVVFKNLKIFLPSLPWANDLDIYRTGKLLLKQWLGKKRMVKNGEVVLAFDHWAAGNYYHWMIESLPRIMVALHRHPDCKIIIPEPAPQYIQKTLELLGCRNLLPLNRNGNEILKFEKLLLPQTVYYENSEDDIPPLYKSQKVNLQEKRYDVKKIRDRYDIENQEPIIAIKNKILDKLPVFETERKRIYVSRAKQKTRRLLNEQAILPLLQRHGFQLICFEDFDFEGQVRLMQQAEIFVGLHGANMVNILFMKQGSKVVELMNTSYVNDAYYQIASSVQLPYYSVSCQMADNFKKETANFSAINDADIMVDLEQLEHTLLLAISQ